MKTRLAVIFGSRACEHDVSIISGLQALYAANTQKYDAFPVYISREGTWFVGDALRKMEFYKKPDWSAVRPVIPAGKRGKLALVDAQEHKGLFKKSLPDEIADVVMPVLHGMNGEDGTLQGMLEMWGVPYTSSGVLGSAVGMDKIAMKQLFRGCGFPVLDWVGVDRGQWFDEREAILDRVESVLPYPVFVKPANLGSSIGISRADNRQALSDALDVAAAYADSFHFDFDLIGSHLWDRHILVDNFPGLNHNGLFHEGPPFSFLAIMDGKFRQVNRPRIPGQRTP